MVSLDGAEKADAMGSFGDNLRREREMRGISLHDIAEGTKISVRFLRALEEDRVDVLPGGLFPRAFVKQYALFLGLDVEKAVADFVAAHDEAPQERKAPSGPARRPAVTVGQAFLAAVAILAVALTLRRGGESRARPEPTPAPVAAAPAVLPTDRVYPSPSVTPAAVTAGAGLVLTMTAEQECWVEARADGETVVNRVLAQGESQTLEARGEIVLSVGNAGGISIRVNDRPARPLGRSGEVRKNIVITPQSIPSLVQQDGLAEPDGHSG